MEKNNIESITIVTQVGVNVYAIGDNKGVTLIQEGVKYINGDPYEFYFIYAKDKVLANINKLIPCDITFK